MVDKLLLLVVTIGLLGVLFALHAVWYKCIANAADVISESIITASRLVQHRRSRAFYEEHRASTTARDERLMKSEAKRIGRDKYDSGWYDMVTPRRSILPQFYTSHYETWELFPDVRIFTRK